MGVGVCKNKKTNYRILGEFLCAKCIKIEVKNQKKQKNQKKKIKITKTLKKRTNQWFKENH